MQRLLRDALGIEEDLEMEKQIIPMTKAKETKNTVVYEAQGFVAIRSVYVQRAALTAGIPEKIRVTVEKADG